MSERIRVVSGIEKFSPIQFHTFDLGPFEYETEIKQGETPEQAFHRAWTMLQRMKRDAWQEAKREYIERVRDIASDVRASRGG